MSHLFLIFGSFYLVITNIGVILHHNLKTKDMKRLLLTLPFLLFTSCVEDEFKTDIIISNGCEYVYYYDSNHKFKTKHYKYCKNPIHYK